MIITRQKKYETILNFVDRSDRIAIIGCGDCATVCKTGGEDEVAELKEKLSAEGYEVTVTQIFSVACNIKAVMSEIKPNLDEYKKVNKVVVLACGAGVQTLTDYFQDKDISVLIISGLDSLFLGKTGLKGEFNEYCALCGECTLARTESICTFTRCPKNMMNGPCGGSDEGKCEVDPEKDCVWNLIYERAKNKGTLETLDKYLKPKDYRRSLRPRKYNLNE